MIKGQPTVELDHVSAFLREGQSVDDVSLVVRHGELVALVGGDGSGKSLALLLAAGIESPLKGTVRLLGIDPALAPEPAYVDLRRRVGIVFDRPALLSNMSVFNNIALPLRYHTDSFGTRDRSQSHGGPSPLGYRASEGLVSG